MPSPQCPSDATARSFNMSPRRRQVARCLLCPRRPLTCWSSTIAHTVRPSVRPATSAKPHRWTDGRRASRSVVDVARVTNDRPSASSLASTAGPVFHINSIMNACVNPPRRPFASQHDYINFAMASRQRRRRIALHSRVSRRCCGGRSQRVVVPTVYSPPEFEPANMWRTHGDFTDRRTDVATCIDTLRHTRNLLIIGIEKLTIFHTYMSFRGLDPDRGVMILRG